MFVVPAFHATVCAQEFVPERAAGFACDDGYASYSYGYINDVGGSCKPEGFFEEEFCATEVSDAFVEFEDQDGLYRVLWSSTSAEVEVNFGGSCFELGFASLNATFRPSERADLSLFVDQSTMYGQCSLRVQDTGTSEVLAELDGGSGLLRLDPSVVYSLSIGCSTFTAGIDSFIARARLQALPSCPADLDGDGELTIFDFLTFQNLFDAGDPAADFDGDGSLTLFDFLAFQNAFDAGCP